MINRPLMIRVGWVVMGWVWVVGVVSCGNREQEARSELSAKSYSYTIDDFMRAAREGNVSALKHFVEAGMVVDATDGEGATALFRAAQAGRVEAVAFLAERGANVEAEGTSFDTPLMAAARTGTVETVQALLAAGAKPEVRSSRQAWTALTAAAYRGEVEIVKVLAPLSGGSLDEALQLACVQGNPAVVDVLLRQGADVFSRSKGNWTPMMYAAANGHEDVVRLLMLSGSNKLAVDSNQRTAADLALEFGHSGVIPVLDDPRNAPLTPPAERSNSLVAETEGVETDASAVAENAESGRGEADAGADALAVAARRDDGPAAVDPDFAIEVPESIPFAEDAAAESDGAMVAATRSPGRAVVPDRSQSYPRLQGATLPGLVDGSTEAVRERVRLRDFREGQLPIVLENIPAVGESARIRVLSRAGSAPEIVPAGGAIGDTGLELVRVERKFMDSKMGEGRLIDVSHAVVRDRATGRRHIVKRQQPASSSEATALISAGPNGEVYEVREGDEFSAGDNSPVRYQVLDVRPTQVVVENLQTRETVTLARGYAQ